MSELSDQTPEEALRSVLRKRSIDELETVPELDESPSKRRRGDASPVLVTNGEHTDTDVDALINGNHVEDEPAVETPQATPRRRGRPPKNPRPGDTPTGRKTGQTNPETPLKAAKSGFSTPRKQAADRSARKKSARALIDHIASNISDDEDDYDGLAREIYESSEEDEEDNLRSDGLAQDSGPGSEAATPSQTPKRRGRPKRVKSPTPPRDLPPHEQYFVQNKPGRPKTSDNNLSSLGLLSHEEYFAVLRDHADRHAPDMDNLQSLHAESFPQWAFELLQGFSLCLYGYGSKRALLRSFAKHVHAKTRGQRARFVIVNGYTETTTIREVLGTLGSAVDPTQRIPTSQPSVMAQQVINQLEATDSSLFLIINSIDAPPLRKPGVQAVLAKLASHPRVNLACSADTPDFPLLWDIGIRSAFNFAFHDATTFVPFTVELDVVDEVHELLGRKAHRINGREGVAFVLKSLPENAKNLFRLLVSEVLVAMEEGDGGDLAAEESEGVEYRMLYNKAVEEFICSSEVAFRTLLKEFHDHQMITSYKDALGTELLSVPFKKEELEAILEDLMG
ncbi:Origin recognition complex subunit [Paramyrothecium foliicola]|nr:Origin recognition complex subunit [Paramyrothecium foliicola]